MEKESCHRVSKGLGMCLSCTKRQAYDRLRWETLWGGLMTFLVRPKEYTVTLNKNSTNNTRERAAQIPDHKPSKVLCCLWHFITSHWYKFQREFALKISFPGCIFWDKYSHESNKIIYSRICRG